jgi:SAM-dependent methyltransferase
MNNNGPVKPMQNYIPEDSAFLTTDTRTKRWAVPYSHECLNARIDKLLGQQQDAIEGKKILDVGSHMGTFAYAAHRMGAGFIHGVDVELKMVEKCRNLFQDENIPTSACRFEVADVFDFLESTPEKSFDTVICFGMLYYTSEPLRLLKLMCRAAKETVLLDTFTAGYAAVQGKDAASVYPGITDETLDLPLMIVSLTQPEKKDYRLPESFDYRGKDLSTITLPTRALLEIWFQQMKVRYRLLDWTEHCVRPCSYHDLFTPKQKQDSHWSDIYSSGIRVSYRLSINNVL